MPRRHIHADQADKQRAYRARQNIGAELRELHEWAKNGHVLHVDFMLLKPQADRMSSPEFFRFLIEHLRNASFNMQIHMDSWHFSDRRSSQATAANLAANLSAKDDNSQLDPLDLADL